MGGGTTTSAYRPDSYQQPSGITQGIGALGSLATIFGGQGGGQGGGFNFGNFLSNLFTGGGQQGGGGAGAGAGGGGGMGAMF